ncbi:MAG TPA: FAD-binding oxidoreductase [Candidatus Paceibacterota bacterium]|nr:FAD-binding oxidoreductase [Candidatus Paceibacterota bacterium]
MALAEELGTLDCGEVDSSPATRAAYSHDASIFEVTPEAVVFPRSPADIGTLVSYATSHPGVSLVARAAGTDMGGGAIGSSVVLDMTRHLNHLDDIGKDSSVHGQDGYAVVEPGMFYRDFERETLKRDLIMPTFPGSRDLCALGGMVANNAGGERSLRYGQTVDFVRSVKMVCADGVEHEFGPRTAAQVRGVIAAGGWEGELYGRMHELVVKNWDLIAAHRPKVSKNSSGYFLWRVWDRAADTLDLSQLIAGSQGTLGIITEATIGLVRPPKHRKLVIAFLHDLTPVAKAVNDLLALKPESIESFDDTTLKFTLRYLGDFVRLMGARGFLGLAWQFLPEAFMVLRGGLPKLILLVEFAGDDETALDLSSHRAVEALTAYGIQARPARDEREANKYWTIRRQSFQVIRSHTHGVHSTPFIDDFIVPPATMPQFLPELDATLAPYHLNLTIAGHAGNGNFHIIPLMDLRSESVRAIIPELADKVYNLVLKYGGSITAEHNDGLIRGHYSPKMWGPDMYRLFQEVKRIWDPKGIFNPGKKVNVDWPWALAHIRRD